MNSLQVWMLIGIPALALAGAMFVRRSSWLALVGYAAMLGGFGGMAVFDRTSAAVFGGMIALLYASGRGGSVERLATRDNEEGVPDAALPPDRRAGNA